MIKTEDFTKWFGLLMAEAFGVSESDSVFILDSNKSGLLGTIETLSAETASTAPKPENATIASHAAHILFLLQLFEAGERGEHSDPDWSASWKIRAVTEAEWQTLRINLRSAYESVQTLVRARTDWSEPPLASALMLLAHCSYHVGEIRQLLTTIKSV